MNEKELNEINAHIEYMCAPQVEFTIGDIWQLRDNSKKLVAEVERLRAALEKYADKQNWGRSRSGYADRFMLVEENDCFGWDIASEALKGGEG